MDKSIDILKSLFPIRSTHFNSSVVALLLHFFRQRKTITNKGHRQDDLWWYSTSNIWRKRRSFCSKPEKFFLIDKYWRVNKNKKISKIEIPRKIKKKFKCISKNRISHYNGNCGPIYWKCCWFWVQNQEFFLDHKTKMQPLDYYSITAKSINISHSFQ